MNKLRIVVVGLFVPVFLFTSKLQSQNMETKQQVVNNISSKYNDFIIRISEIEVYAKDLDKYNKILKEESSISVKIEEGVIAIFPMCMKEDPTSIRIVEIYASHDAYLAHLKTEHFKHYKESTLEMIKSLRLIDMNALDPLMISSLFEKLQ